MKGLKSSSKNYFAFLSKEGAILIHNVVMTIVCASVFLGTIYPLIIEALNLVNKEMPEQSFSAVILGDDQGRKVYKKKLLRLVEQYRLNNHIQFIDKCELMPLAYKISDIIVSASIEPEAFGRVSVEAQSMEKLIIASNIGGSKETIVNDKTGFLF